MFLITNKFDMNTATFTQFLDKVEEVAANLDEVPDELLKQLSYLVLLEIKEREEKLTEDDADYVHPAREAMDDMERDWASSHNSL